MQKPLNVTFIGNDYNWKDAFVGKRFKFLEYISESDILHKGRSVQSSVIAKMNRKLATFPNTPRVFVVTSENVGQYHFMAGNVYEILPNK
jgi:hypothetical protein